IYRHIHFHTVCVGAVNRIQQFIIVENEKLKEFAKHVAYSQWALVDENHTAIRLCTSWATTEETIDAVLSYL
ncbi:MAG: hypothetical protein IKZ24_04670, partial [Burkholderiaceae bacterium]|nr:hypothetical protein [Burkholderiaceae bacterium]